jgi:hypothetical protein
MPRTYDWIFRIASRRSSRRSPEIYSAPQQALQVSLQVNKLEQPYRVLELHEKIHIAAFPRLSTHGRPKQRQ